MCGHVETGINSGTSHNLSNQFSTGKVNMRLSSGPKFQELGEIQKTAGKMDV